MILYIVEQQESKHTGNYQFNADKALLNFEKFFGTKNPFDGIFSITNSLLSKPEAIKNLDGSFGKFGTSLPIEKAPVIVQELPVTLEELYKGAFKKLQIERKLVNKQSPENTYTETKQFTVEIKRGWRDGTKVVFAGQGNQSAKLNDGDVVFVVKQLPHARFKRNGNNLITVKRIGLADALTGANFNIETLDGRELMTQIHDVIT